jgi:tRNA (adenine57-N1/adenine58-N1)-methyltransferase
MRTPDFFKKLSRGPQVVLLKDAAYASAFAGVANGDRVLDAGSGSGWLAIYLATIVGPAGKVYSYEWREDFHLLSKKNGVKAGLDSIIEFKQKSIFDGIDETELDAVFLDLANAENALPHALNALKKKGACVAFLPNVEQVKTFVLKGEELGFVHERTIDVMPREWLVRPQGTRPETKGLMHTLFLSFLRKP